MTYYIASKTKHAPRWIELRKLGLDIIGSWIDEAAPGATLDARDLAKRCVTEAIAADVFILYCEPDDSLKGAWIEAGARLGAGKKVHCCGRSANHASIFEAHPLWIIAGSIDDVIAASRLAKVAKVRGGAGDAIDKTKGKSQ